MFEFVKCPVIMEMARKEAWGQFSLDLHRAFKNDPGLINRCDMLGISSENFGERIKISFILPGKQWLFENLLPEKFPNFPIRSNGTKFAVPFYLDLVMQNIKMKEKNHTIRNTAYNHFPVHVGPEKVQILVYGPDCVFPFRVTSK